jgi:hypothetical protein
MFDLILRVQEIMFLMDCLHLLSRTAQMLESLVSLYIKALQHAAKPRCPRQRQKLQPSNCRSMDSSSRNLGAFGSFGGGPFRVVLILTVLVIHQGSSPIHLLSSSPPPGTSFLIISAVKKAQGQRRRWARPGHHRRDRGGGLDPRCRGEEVRSKRTVRRK